MLFPKGILGFWGLLSLGPNKKPFQICRAGIQGTSVPCHYHVLHMDKRLIQRGIAVDDIETRLRSTDGFNIFQPSEYGESG